MPTHDKMVRQALTMTLPDPPEDVSAYGALDEAKRGMGHAATTFALLTLNTDLFKSLHAKLYHDRGHLQAT